MEVVPRPRLRFNCQPVAPWANIKALQLALTSASDLPTAVSLLYLSSTTTASVLPRSIVLSRDLPGYCLYGTTDYVIHHSHRTALKHHFLNTTSFFFHKSSKRYPFPRRVKISCFLFLALFHPQDRLLPFRVYLPYSNSSSVPSPASPPSSRSFSSLSWCASILKILFSPFRSLFDRHIYFQGSCLLSCFLLRSP